MAVKKCVKYLRRGIQSSEPNHHMTNGGVDKYDFFFNGPMTLLAYAFGIATTFTIAFCKTTWDEGKKR